MDCRIVVSEFVLQSRYYVHFRTNTIGKGMNPLYPASCGLNSTTTVLLRLLTLNNLQRLICHKTKKPNQTKRNTSFIIIHWVSLYGFKRSAMKESFNCCKISLCLHMRFNNSSGFLSEESCYIWKLQAGPHPFQLPYQWRDVWCQSSHKKLMGSQSTSYWQASGLCYPLQNW